MPELGRTLRRALAASAVISGLASTGACGAADEHASLVVGVQTEEMGGVLGSLHMTTTVDGAPQTDETFAVGNGAPPVLPHEIPLRDARVGSKLAVRVEGFPAGGAPGTPPILVRTAETSFVAGDTRLLRLRLETRCLTAIVGGLSGPTCTAPQTCTAGRCADDTVFPDELEIYRAGWADDTFDVCRPKNHGPPEIVVGTGQTDYQPVVDGQTLQAELGPQKGHHLWIALRMRNLKQAGSTTTVTAVQPETGVTVPPTSFVFTFDPDEGGYCKLYGLRYQLDNGGIDYRQFLGKPLDVTVAVHDTTGADASAVAHIQVDPIVLGE